MPEPLLDTAHQLSFDELAELQDYLRRLLQDSRRSLETFHVAGSGGFAHRVDPTAKQRPTKWSKSSTATCVGFLRAAGMLQEGSWQGEGDTLIKEIVDSDWNSAELGENNPFTVSFLLEALADLGGKAKLSKSQQQVVREKLTELVHACREGEDGGGVRLQEYRATAFLTYKAASALKRWGQLSRVKDRLEHWNWANLYKESVLVASGSVDADVFEAAYSVLLASKLASLDHMTPQQRQLLRFGIEQFFDAQRPDGTWPRSRPLFVYPNLGHAYCFDYELLAALLADRQMRSHVYERLGDLRKAAEALDERKYPLRGPRADLDAPYGWASGHHGSETPAESWATAAALEFCFALDRLVAEAVRRETFKYAVAPYVPPATKKIRRPFLSPNDFLDSQVRRGGKSRSLRGLLSKQFIAPLVDGRKTLEEGRPLPDKVSISAILYGPPGTSKTELAKLIAKALGWPLLALDPSHLTRRGLNEVHAEANKLFGMLERCEQVVVLLDEFDELVREREGEGDIESRFLTTAMLPKLSALSKRRRIVYLLATNHLEQFDAAIGRPGRFDVVVPVLAPTAAEKRRKWPQIETALAAVPAPARIRAARVLGDLTYLETEALVEKLDDLQGAQAILHEFDTAAKTATLRQPFDGAAKKKREPGHGKRDWHSQILAQQDRIRGLGL